MPTFADRSMSNWLQAWYRLENIGLVTSPDR